MKEQKFPARLKTLGEKLKKYRYPALILLLGLALMLIPSRSDSKKKTAQAPPVVAAVTEKDYKTQVEEQLTSVLRQVQGTGRVTVMLTLKSSAQTIYQTDTALTSQSGEGSVANTSTETTVILSRDAVGQEAAVAKTLYPAFLGAVVVCEGADDPTVRLNVINAVASTTGLSSEKITVVKMK